MKLYTESVGEEGLDDCLIAIIYAVQLSFYQMQVVPESLPVLEIEQSNVNDTDSSLGMSEGTSNVVMGSTTGAQSDGQETGSSVNMSLGTSTSNGAQSNEHVTSSSVNMSVDTSNVAMESATPASTEAAADRGNSMMIDMN